LPGIAFQLALEAVSPLLGGLTKWAKGLETWINNARINSCETAKAIVSTAAESVGYSSQETCADLADRHGPGKRPGCGTAALLRPTAPASWPRPGPPAIQCEATRPRSSAT
jgi:O-succinylbenzoate synthase